VSAFRNLRVVAICVAMAAGMGGLSYAAVPIYRMFCQVTGFAGTTQKAEVAPDVVLDRVVTVRFDSNVTPGMEWAFKPVQRTMDVKLGESALAFYTATNTSDAPITGTASFNVSPDIAGGYFSKIECFCFTEQRLEPGETIEMPVSFFVDPEMAKNRDANSVREITLSYTFYPVDDDKSASVVEAPRGQPKQGG
jgi:cytochrome c oxidase assembly protein subunit 11